MIKKGYIEKEVIQSLIAQTNLGSLIASYLQLKNQSSNLVGLCPFHSEKTPSFTVSNEKGLFYCFGCGASGNVIDFLMRYQSVDFLSAVYLLAEFNGVQLSTNSQKSKFQWAYDLNAKVNQFYVNELHKNQKAQDYLKNRGLDLKTIDHFSIGFAPNQWQFLTEKQFLNDIKMLNNLIKIGLISEKNGRYFDRFRNRILFPIRNLSGNVVGFGGRVIDSGEPKYLNSPQSEIFSKSNELYGLYEMDKRYSRQNKILLVEGYMDVIGLYQHGINYALASLGTAINENHIKNLLKITNEVVFCFDGDLAGKNAAKKGVMCSLNFLSDQFNIELIWLENDEDPDSFIQKKSKAAFEKKLNHSQNWAEFLITDILENYDITRPIENEKFIIELKNLYQKITHFFAKRVFISYASNFLVLSPQRVEKLFDFETKKILQTNQQFIGRQQKIDSFDQNFKKTSVRSAILIALDYPNILEKIRKPKYFDLYFSDRFSSENLKLNYEKMNRLMQSENLLAMNVAEVEYLSAVIAIIEDNQNINAAALKEKIRDLADFVFYEKLLVVKKKLLVLDNLGLVSEKNMANIFLDALLKIEKEYLKMQKLAEFKKKV